MTRLVSLLVILRLAAAATALAAELPLYPGLGPVHLPVTTKSPIAQKYFDQGLSFAYAFNHDEAELSFARAESLDPTMAMAPWGIALVLGPNYNLPADVQRGRKAYEAVRRAKALEAGASPEERDLIDALMTRYDQDGNGSPALDQSYADAMRTVAHRYPADLDVQTLFAESLMDLHPWQLWRVDGTPGVNTIEIVSTLENVLKRDPNHVGANHYYIHAVEASPHPERATASADRLAALAPGAGHLVHMPAHIYVRTGRFHDSAETNLSAIKVDDEFLAKSGEGGVYPLMYRTHNIHFLCYSQMMEGRADDALKSARLLETRVPIDAVRAMPMAEFMVPMPLIAEARFGKWDEILKEPAPPADLPFASTIWHYARGLAFVGKGKLDAAGREQRVLDAVVAAIPADRPIGTSNHTLAVSTLASVLLDGEVASAFQRHSAAEKKFVEAVTLQDALVYEEPPIWYYPARERLGAELLVEGKAAAAEAVYRADLKANPGNPRSLSGLAQSLRAQGKADQAAKADAEFKQGWRYADYQLEPLRVAAGNATDRDSEDSR